MRIIIYLFILCAVPVMSFGQSPQSALITSDECELIFLTSGSLKQAGEWQKAYDTLRYYIENCAMEPKSARAFSSFYSPNYLRSDDPNRYPEHLQWLKKVLYYNPDSGYYCADVISMLSTFQYFDSVHGKYLEGGVTVAKYIIDSAHCDNYDQAIKENIDADMQTLYKKWKDTVQDSMATPFNPQFPSLEDLDLTILRGPQNSVTPITHESRLGELLATRNPFTDILELKYRLDKSAMVRIDVYDLLGRAVYSEGHGYKAEGEHVLSLQSKAWSSGSYYVRLSSPSGEVKTVKVVKE
ncbi:MAG TPA: T9SS type A sorting domain-containing protein [Candidatus Kapabacteria bacterium]